MDLNLLSWDDFAFNISPVFEWEQNFWNFREFLIEINFDNSEMSIWWLGSIALTVTIIFQIKLD